MLQSSCAARQAPSASRRRARPFDETVQREQRQRHPRQPLQLHVGDVREAIGREADDDAGQDRGGAIAGQPVGEHGRRPGRRRQPGNQEPVVDERRRNAGPQERRARQPDQQHRVGVGERVPGRVEDVGVEQGRGLVDELMGDP
jgi:hypothetical protein